MATDSASALRFKLRNDAVLEDFGDRSLVLLGDSLRMRAINRVARELLARLDGARTVQDISGDMEPEDVRAALLEMERQGIVRRVVAWSRERTERMSDAKYLANPDVSFRPEDDDGGILFNPDTDSLEVVNPVAAEIWKFLAAPRTQAEVAAHLCAVCADAPREQVAQDVAEFIGSLARKGYIGVVAEPGA